jgi:hypothetical protein
MAQRSLNRAQRRRLSEYLVSGRYGRLPSLQVPVRGLPVPVQGFSEHSSQQQEEEAARYDVDGVRLLMDGVPYTQTVSRRASE